MHLRFILINIYIEYSEKSTVFLCGNKFGRKGEEKYL